MRIRTQPLFNNYNKYGYIETTYIAIARPGKRLLGVLNGVDESTCRLEINLNNTAVLTFDVNRFVNNKESQFYNRIEQLMELEIPGVGWFKINEQPTISGNGNTEVMSVRAESLEIELAQYFIKGMEINMGTVSSTEMIATDNTYKALDNSDSYFSWTNVKFYKDTTLLELLISIVDDEWTALQLINVISEYPCLWNSWRITYDPGSFKTAINSAADNMTNTDRAKTLRSYEDKITSQLHMYFLSQSYPEVRDYLVIKDVDLKEYDEEDRHETGNILTVPEMLQLELRRQKDLSLMDVILEDTDWTVGFVDDSVLSESDDEDDLIPLKDKVGCFEIGSSNVYNFLMQEASPYFRCIFVFDTINKKVNCYNVNNLGEDTNIVINFANIQNSIERSDDDAIKTVFHVSGGDDLDIRFANLGEETIIDLSYYMNEDHFDAATIDKYNNWVELREELRKQYMDLSVDYYNKLEDITYIEERVPLDGADPSLYSSFSDEELEEEKKKYEAILRAMQSYYVNDNNEFDIDALMQYPEEYNEYLYITTVILSNPLTALELVYYDENTDNYLMQGDDGSFHLGQIDLIMLNRKISNGDFVNNDDTKAEKEKKTSYKLQKEYLENYMYDFVTYGDSYGLNELKVRIDDLKNKMQSLWAKGYSVDPDDEETWPPEDENQYDDDYHRRKYELYEKYEQALEEAEAVLALRQQEDDLANQELQDIKDQMIAIQKQALITDETYGFTPEELELFKEYYVHTDYVNENLIVTDIYTALEIVDTEDELYKLAQEELYASAHPQWRWTTSQNNLFLMPEFKNWHNQLDIGNFITIGMEQNPLSTHPELYKRNNINYLTKLRVVSIGLNPFMIEPDIDITFSSIINYKSKQNDFVDLFELNNGVGDSLISSYFNSKHLDGSYSVDSSFLLKLLQGGMKTYIDNATSDSVMDSYLNIIGPVNSLNKSMDTINNWVIETGADNDRIIKSWTTEAAGSNDAVVTGGAVIANGIFGKHLAIDEIMSNNYSGLPSGEHFSQVGTYWNLLNGNLVSPGFSVINTNIGTDDSPIWTSDAYFKGNITALAGYIGGTDSTHAWEILPGIIETTYQMENGVDENDEPIYEDRYMGMATAEYSDTAFYANAQTSGGEDGVFRVGHDGILHAVGAEIEGDITASTLTCKDGNNETKLSWDGSNLTVKGTINATAGNIGGCLIDATQGLQIDNTHITSVSADKINAGTITGININGTNITGTSTITGSTISGGSITINKFSVDTAGNVTITTSDIASDLNNSFKIKDNYGNYMYATPFEISMIDVSNNRTIINANAITTTKINVNGNLSCHVGYFTTTGSGSAETGTCNARIALDGRLVKVTGTSSSIRYKNILSYLQNDDINKLYEMPVYWFKYKDNYIGKNNYLYNKEIPGFVVEDWIDVVPTAVCYEDGKPDSWNSAIVVPLMFQMIKNDHEEILQLKDRIKELENKLL